MSIAWNFSDEVYDIGINLFADTEAKAKNYIFRKYEDEIPPSAIKPERMSELDYLDRPDGYIMDWDNVEDRSALVKLGSCCDDPSCVECIDCESKGFCCHYEEGFEPGFVQDYCTTCERIKNCEIYQKYKYTEEDYE